MIFLHAARGTYDGTHSESRLTWDGYIEWSQLTHVREIVSLDYMLNKDLVQPDYDDAYDWEQIHVFGLMQTGLYTTREYVLRRMTKTDVFNLLTVVIEPNQECRNMEIEDYDFMGYDLVDQDFGNSALTNCGGFAETFQPDDLNDKGLFDSYDTAYDVKHRLLKNNPNEFHADTNVIAIWRHRTIGRGSLL